MPSPHCPRRGSLQYWPRKRAKRIYARVRNWPKLNTTKLLAFIGYKVGMTHLMVRDNTSTSMVKGQIISTPATIVECPPVKPYSLRFYKQTHDGLKVLSDIYVQKLDKEVKRKTCLSKVKNEIPQVFDDVRLIVYTQPRLTGIGKKKPELFEIAVSGSKEAKLDFLKPFLEKEIKLSDVFKENQALDIHAITKGKGTAGSVQRFGVAIRSHKSHKTKRGPGALGPWQPKKVRFQVPHAGQRGYHQRTEYNKQALKISNKAIDVTPKGGWKHYGLIKNDFIIIRGSIQGPSKRTIIMTDAMKPAKLKNFEIISIKK